MMAVLVIERLLIVEVSLADDVTIHWSHAMPGGAATLK